MKLQLLKLQTRSGEVLKTEKIKLVESDLNGLASKARASQFFRVSLCSPFVQEYFLRILKSRCSSPEIVHASLVNDAWVEENSVQMDLFCNDKVFIVLDAAGVSKQLIEKIVDTVRSQVIFCDLKKMDKFEGLIEGVELVPPKFWEFKSFSHFLCKLHNLTLRSQEIEEIETSIEKNIDSYWCLFLKISQHSSRDDGNIILEIIKEDQYFDQFRFTDFLNQKKKAQLYKSLLEVKSFSELEKICSFLVTHGMKILDPHFLTSKKKLTKYDQGIMAANKLWIDNELVMCMTRLKRVSYFCRSRNKEAFIELMKASVL